VSFSGFAAFRSVLCRRAKDPALQRSTFDFRTHRPLHGRSNALFSRKPVCRSACQSSTRKPADPLKRRRGIYILPNLFTTASLFAGFYAIVQAMNGRYE
jgi:hypothetical protein